MDEHRLLLGFHLGSYGGMFVSSCSPNVEIRDPEGSKGSAFWKQTPNDISLDCSAKRESRSMRSNVAPTLRYIR